MDFAKRAYKCLGAGLVVMGGSVGFGLSVPTTAGAATPNANKSTGVTKSAIKVGIMTDLTGGAASSFGQNCVDGIEAAFKQQNAKGGFNGRKATFVVADGGSNPAQGFTATQSLVSQGVFGIVVCGISFTTAFRYTVQQGIPVTGDPYDGPEWGSKSNPNLFAMWGSPASDYPVFPSYGQYFKQAGVTKLAVIGGSDASTAQGNANAQSASAAKVGIPTVLKDYTQPTGSTNYAATALKMKDLGVDGVDLQQVTVSNIAILTDLVQDGVHLKGEFVSGAYQQALLQSQEVVSELQGTAFQSQAAPAPLNTPGTKSFMSALAKYANYTLPNPQEGQIFGWYAAQTFVKGLQVAGKSPTWGSFIQNLHKVKNYTANGTIGNVDYSKYGTYDPNAAGNCWYQTKVSGDSLVMLRNKPYCGSSGTKQ